MIRGAVFDMDDTLYLERDYVRSGFGEVSRLLSKGDADSEARLFAFLWERFERGERGNHFDLLLESDPRLKREASVDALVRAYRLHAPLIRPLPGMTELIRDLKDAGVRIAVVTDGPRDSQARKAEALGLHGLADPILLTDDWGREWWKPHPRAFRHLESLWDFAPETMIYVGDNPAKDFVAPKALGWKTLRLRLPEQLRFADDPPAPDHAPDEEALSPEALVARLKRWTGG
jgi:putative hydrolase of the HAD superfamily